MESFHQMILFLLLNNILKEISDTPGIDINDKELLQKSLDHSKYNIFTNFKIIGDSTGLPDF